MSPSLMVEKRRSELREAIREERFSLQLAWTGREIFATVVFSGKCNKTYSTT